MYHLIHILLVIQLSVPLLESQPAPYTGILFPESRAIQCAEDAASSISLRVQLDARTRELSTTTTLFQDHIKDQDALILDLSTTSWWDTYGTMFSFGVGMILGLTASILIVSLVP